MKRLISFFMIWFFITAPLRAQTDSFPATKLAGHWSGKGAIIVSWCAQDSLPIHIAIHNDATVSGNIGDATIVRGTLRVNSWLLRLLGNSTYVIETELRDALIANEHIRRRHFTLFLDLTNDGLRGGFHSSGSKGGGKNAMKLSGSGLLLVKQ